MTAMRPLGVLGNVNVDLILGPAEPWPQPGTEVMVAHDDLRVGGAAGNMRARLAGAGRAARDRRQRRIRHVRPLAASTRSEPRAARWAVETAATTVSVGITHPGGERTFFTSRGHLPLFSWAAPEAHARPERNPRRHPLGLRLVSHGRARGGLSEAVRLGGCPRRRDRARYRLAGRRLDVLRPGAARWAGCRAAAICS